MSISMVAQYGMTTEMHRNWWAAFDAMAISAGAVNTAKALEKSEEYIALFWFVYCGIFFALFLKDIKRFWNAN